ncbi:MAG: hypothetical protein H0T79_02495 [Deltaproteobacteria bacterium]|nr:hypothetical protein [Deltaproteobacteria bacterium]
MRRRAGEAFAVTLFAIAGGCYDPALIEGLACSPNRACPTDQVCDVATNRCLREPAPPPDGGEPDASIDGPRDAPIDAPASGFHDDFTRPDGDALGNGWLEKTPLAFALQDGEVVRASGSSNYRDNLCYRPASEDVLDVAISMQVRFTASPPGNAQLFVRGVSASLDAPDSYDGYLLYVTGDQGDNLVLGRQIGTPFVTELSSFTLSPALNTTDTYRLTLSAEGTTTVMLAAKVERLALGVWTTIGQTAVPDTSAARIVVAGTVGFSSSANQAYVYDEFRRTDR